MNLSTQSIPVLFSTKIRPPKHLFDGFKDGIRPNALIQQHPLPPVRAAPGLFGQAQPAPPPVPVVHGGAELSGATPFGYASGSGGGGAFGQPPPFGASQAPQQQQQRSLFGASNSGFGQNAFTQSAFGQSAPAAWAGSYNSFEPSAQPLSLAHTMPGPSADEGWQAVDDADATAAEPTLITEPSTVVHESPLALTYRVEGASRVPSDGVAHQLAVAVLPFAATLQHVAVPKARPIAYLHATVRNTSDYRLLTGPVHAFVDDAFAARTSLPRDVASGDTFHCTLGADPATRIRYTRTARPADVSANATRAFSEQWASTEYVSRTTITNSHPFALRALVLRDSVPVSEDGERVNVVLRSPAGLADLEQGEELKVNAVGEAEEEGEEEEGETRPERSKAKRTVRWCKAVLDKGGRKDGLFEWVVDIGAGEEITIETKWDVKAPVSLKWVESV